MPAIQEWKTRAAGHLRRDSEDWKISPRHERLLILIPFIIAVVVAAALPFKDFYLWLVNEDSLIEYADASGRWITERADGHDRPETEVEG